MKQMKKMKMSSEPKGASKMEKPPVKAPSMSYKSKGKNSSYPDIKEGYCKKGMPMIEQVGKKGMK